MLLFFNDTFWLPQKGIAQLFGCTTDNFSLHLKNIFNSDELESNSVTEEISATASDGKNYKTKFYNLDTIIAVGYRVNSKQARNLEFGQHKSSKNLSLRALYWMMKCWKTAIPLEKIILMNSWIVFVRYELVYEMLNSKDNFILLKNKSWRVKVSLI